jgi:hypothetical protein
MLKTYKFLGVVGLTVCATTLFSFLAYSPWFALIFLCLEAIYFCQMLIPPIAKLQGLGFLIALSLLAWY